MALYNPPDVQSLELLGGCPCKGRGIEDHMNTYVYII